MDNSVSPLITVIIPTFRRPVLLRRAILSVLQQTHQNYKICIYDNASNDGTEGVVQEFCLQDSRVNYYGHTQNIGVIANFNFALKKVDTPFYSLLSDDDLLAPNFLEIAMRGFREYPGAFFSVTELITIDKTGSVVAEPTVISAMQFFTPEVSSLLALQGALPGFWTNCIFRKEVPEKMGYYNAELQPLADFAYNTRLYMGLPFVVCPGLGSILMAHENSGSSEHEPLSYVTKRLLDKVFDDIFQVSTDPSAHEIPLRQYLQPDYYKSALTQISRGLKSRNYMQAFTAAEFLENCGYLVHSKCLSVIIFLYSHFLPFRFFIYVIFQFQAFILADQRKKLTKKFRENLLFLDKLNKLSGYKQ